MNLSLALTTTITSQGQVTLPIAIRKILGVKPSEKVTFMVGSSGGVTISKPNYPTISSLKGAAGLLKKPLSWREMKAIAYEDRPKP